MDMGRVHSPGRRKLQSSNENDWNRKALSSLKQGSTPMDMFITMFNTFQALAQYPEDQLIELLEQNAN